MYQFHSFYLNRPGFQSTTYRTRREHANYYTTDKVFST
jgi:hypothetical protein